MTDDIRPALTPEEWEKNGPPWQNHGAFPARLAFAALSLHGHPQGFTRADVKALRVVQMQFSMADDEWKALESLAARIEALLPPEDA